MTELEPCPFCGNNETHLLEIGAIDHGYEKRPHGFRFTGYVTCLNCFAKATGTSFHWDEDSAKSAAIRAWNRRADNG